MPDPDLGEEESPAEVLVREALEFQASTQDRGTMLLQGNRRLERPACPIRGTCCLPAASSAQLLASLRLGLAVPRLT